MVPEVVGSIPIIRPKKIMKYYYQTGIAEKDHSSNRLKIAIILLALAVVAAYVGLLVATPALGGWPLVNPRQASKVVQTTPPVKQGYKLYIPKLNVVASDDQVKLTGNPAKQDIVKISGATFQLGVTPEQTKNDSPFYRLNQLRSGDNIFLDYHAQRYAYRVEDSNTKLDDGGLLLHASGKSNVKAEPVGVVAWRNGKPAIDTEAF